jgi:Pyruvate/2-oxoacid:ferredoxin oxidoreductase delta subunit
MARRRVIRSVYDLPVMPLTIQDMTWNKTGTWRYMTPRIQDKTSPCRVACPVGNPIAQVFDRMKRGHMDEALALLLRCNPLPGITGRLCYHPCQAQCLRKKLDSPVAVQALERYAADHGVVPRPERPAATGKSVAILGSGPAGLTCGFMLALNGVDVLILEPDIRPGGFLSRVSTDRLDPGVLEREIDRLADVSGLRIDTGVTTVDPTGFDRVMVDESAHDPNGECGAIIARLSAQLSGRQIEVPINEEFSGFKPSQVAHAIGLGLRMAEVAAAELSIELLKKWENAGGPVIQKEDMRFDRFQEPGSVALVEKNRSLDREGAMAEAERCLSCGTCNLCQRCVISCPDACIDLDETGTRIVLDSRYCKGCGICAYECPRGVLTMEGGS